MNLTPLYPDAARNFDQRAEALVRLLELRVEETTHDSFDPDIHIDGSIPYSDLIDFEQFHRDFLGREDARFFRHGNDWVGFSGSSYQEFAQLAQSMQKTQSLRNTVSESLVCKSLFKWLKGRYFGQSLPPMTSFVLDECGREVIEDLQIWIPISNLRVEAAFEIGRVVLRPMHKEMFDRWEGQVQAHAKNEADRTNIKLGIDRRRHRFQGDAAATITLTADVARASEIGREYADHAVSALRFFSVASLTPHEVSYTDLSGLQHEDSHNYFAVDKEGRIGYGSGFAQSAKPWMLGIAEFNRIHSGGLNILSALLKKTKPSRFQQDTISAVRSYSKAALSKDVSLKFVYILIALESVFLRDNKEPIGSNIKDRLAFLIGTSKGERKDIAKTLAKCYELRAAFLHHGRPITIDDLEVVEPFVVFAWRSIAQLIHLAADDQLTIERLFEDLDDRKWK
jgi:hypothetical protein